jgi:Ala-tRNA(Pro) deacylase
VPGESLREELARFDANTGFRHQSGPIIVEVTYGGSLARCPIMNMLKRCLSYLKRNGIRYSHSTHEPAFTARDVAAADRMPARRLVKTVVYSGDIGYGMLLLPADYVVNFDEVRRLLGLTEIRLATEPELAALFPDCEVGAMPPFGNLFNLPVLVDEDIATAEFFAFSAGTHRDVIRMSGADFHNLVNPLVASFAEKEPAEAPI